MKRLTKRWLATGVLGPMALFFVWLALRVSVMPPKDPVLPPEPPSTAVSEPEPAPTPSVEPAPPVPPERKLWDYGSKFKAGPKYVGRVTNIELLAKKLDGMVLQPGEEFSFNKTVGPRTEKEGYLSAPTYFLGEVLPGIGGGSCQVSSTLYAAALHIGIEVTDRRPHSRKSSYIPAGLDATVNYPKECWGAKRPDKRVCFDLKFKNPYDFPLTFRFRTSDEISIDGYRILTVSVFGTGEVPKVTTRWSVSTSPPFKTRYRKVSWWEDDRKKLKQSGRAGQGGILHITLTYPDGRSEKQSVYSKYQPVPEVWEVGLAFEKPEEPDAGAPENEPAEEKEAP